MPDPARGGRPATTSVLVEHPQGPDRPRAHPRDLLAQGRAGPRRGPLGTLHPMPEGGAGSTNRLGLAHTGSSTTPTPSPPASSSTGSGSSSSARGSRRPRGSAPRASRPRTRNSWTGWRPIGSGARGSIKAIQRTHRDLGDLPAVLARSRRTLRARSGEPPAGARAAVPAGRRDGPRPALAASGLLTEKIGGPSVFPPRPRRSGTSPYKAARWTPSEGEDRTAAASTPSGAARRPTRAFVRSTRRAGR